jgi:hypothetical protein
METTKCYDYMDIVKGACVAYCVAIKALDKRLRRGW